MNNRPYTHPSEILLEEFVKPYGLTQKQLCEKLGVGIKTISEIYNKKVSPAIKEQFENNLSDYIKLMKNRDLIDWIVTISKESKYTLKINFDEQGVFYIDGSIIVTSQDAKEYYIDYMDKKKEKLAMAIYNNGIVSKIKRAWNIFKSKFGKKVL